MERLQQTHPYFVRCIKSNSNKVTTVYSNCLVTTVEEIVYTCHLIILQALKVLLILIIGS